MTAKSFCSFAPTLYQWWEKQSQFTQW